MNTVQLTGAEVSIPSHLDAGEVLEHCWVWLQ